ncbi:MAG: TetR/AcrR family transcriptional regulator [Woeseiaceae bacterium]
MARGRPKQFDDDEVLARAMAVFWRQGYEATSLDDLIEAMGIPRQSLYRTFTDKHTLFLKALEYYDKHVTNVVIGMLNADGPAVDNLRRVFDLWGKTVNAPERIGCLMVNAGVQSSPGDDEVERLVRANQKRGVAALEKALKRAKLEGDIAASVDPKATARTICATINGLLGMSRSGVSDAFKRDVLANLPTLIGMTR